MPGENENWLDRVYSSRGYRSIALAGLAVALVTAPLALPPVQNALFGKTVELSIQVDPDLPAFDINRRFPELSVLYRGRDLTAEDVGLTISRVTLVNSGDLSISDANLSKSDPIGLQVLNGQVLGIISVQASSSHLQRKAVPTLTGRQVTFPSNFIMDPGDYVRFDLLVLKRNRDRLAFRQTGKVEGLREIRLIRSSARQREQPLIWRAFGGAPSVQLLRLIGYFVFGLIIVIFLIAVGAQVGEIKQALRRRRRRKLCTGVKPLLRQTDTELWIML